MKLARWMCLLASAFLADARAHHSMDLSAAKPIEIQGRVVLASWDGAHVVYRLSSANEQGESVTWEVMGASPKILRQRGIGKSTFPMGNTITVQGRFDPHTNVIAPNYFIKKDGQRFAMGFYPPTMTAGGTKALGP